MKALGAVFFLAACATVPTEMHVDLGPSSYAASMSSTIGIGLTPVAEAPRGVKVRYHWTTDSGFFLEWSEVTHEISSRGPETMTERGAKLFWSYDPADPATAERKPVTIVILASDMANGKVLARTDVHLVWDNGVVQVVR
jgi:hypothetical protein